MRKAKLHEIRLPTPYAVWYRYVYGTDLQNQIGPNRFATLLEKNEALELLKHNGGIKCKILNETKIKQVLDQLQSEPWPSWLSVAFYRLAKRLQATK